MDPLRMTRKRMVHCVVQYSITHWFAYDLRTGRIEAFDDDDCCPAWDSDLERYHEEKAHFLDLPCVTLRESEKIVRRMARKRGEQAPQNRFWKWLDERGLREEWDRRRAVEAERRIRAWAEEHGIVLELVE